MGLLGKFTDIRNMKGMIEVIKLSNRLSKHMNKKCRYCDLDLGSGDEYPVVDFVHHLTEKHMDIIDPDDVKLYEKLIKKVLG